jgi:hypothetical protein
LRRIFAHRLTADFADQGGSDQRSARVCDARDLGSSTLVARDARELNG